MQRVALALAAGKLGPSPTLALRGMTMNRLLIISAPLPLVVVQAVGSRRAEHKDDR
jgi:hypothetical protein